MNSNITYFLQGRIGKYSYLYRLSYFEEKPQSDVTIGTVIVNVKHKSTHTNLADIRIPNFATQDKLDSIIDACLVEAVGIHKFSNS